MNKDKHTTIFLTTHYMDEADFLCDRVAIIDHGKILVTDTTQQLKTMVGNDIITVFTTDNSRFLSYLGNTPWIKQIDQHEDNLTIGVERGEEKIPVLIEIAQKNGIQVKSISVHKPTLDDAFLHYTGRSIRDDLSNHKTPERFPHGR
jgi:ABC-2 type transport system ATP-binding protein